MMRVPRHNSTFTSLVDVMDRRLYSAYGPNWDDRMFRERFLPLVDNHSTVLDLGAGRGLVKDMNLRGHAKRVIGVDVDPQVLENPFLDEAKVSNGGTIPFNDETFDLVICNNVVEHLQAPEATFTEVARVLKSGGSFLIKTPNERHYMPLVAKLTPHAFHGFYNRIRGRSEVDTFPTVYAANTPGKVRHFAERAGLKVRKLELVEGRPEYLRTWAPLYLAGWAYERIVNSTDVLAAFRLVLMAQMSKPL